MQSISIKVLYWLGHEINTILEKNLISQIYVAIFTVTTGIIVNKCITTKLIEKKIFWDKTYLINPEESRERKNKGTENEQDKLKNKYEGGRIQFKHIINNY